MIDGKPMPLGLPAHALLTSSILQVCILNWSMGFNSNIRRQASTTYCTHVLQRSLPLLLTVRRSLSERKKSQFVSKLSTTRCGQGVKAAEKPNFKEPKWLLPVDQRADSNAKVEFPNRSLFQVILTTSKDYGSGISDVNAGILMALIGEEGKCFVQRLPNLVSPMMSETIEQSQEISESRHHLYRFQRGAKDVVMFSGPDLGKLEAAWIAPEQGTWKIQDMILRVLPEQFNKDEDDGAVPEDIGGKILQYSFACEEALIGENERTPAAELHTSSVSEISYEEFLAADSIKLTAPLQMSLSQERYEGMKEYETLKISLLSYDAFLIIAGSAVTAVIGDKEIFEGYLIGGILGFLYLFVLERAVDQLPAPSSLPLSLTEEQNLSVRSESKTATGRDSDTTDKNRVDLIKSFAGFRAPLTKLSGFLAVSALIVKTINTYNHALSKEMLFAGAAGFLMTKFATILASNMPLTAWKQDHSPKGKA